MSTTINTFEVPTLDKVSEKNKGILEQMNAKLGFIPNIYATYALSDNALERYTAFANGKTSLNNKEKEIVNLVVSQENGCTYCLAAHTAIGKMNGFTDEQIISIRKGDASFNPKYSALVNATKDIIENKGKVDESSISEFFDAGYTQENLVDLIVGIGEKTITNLLHNVTGIPIDFPEAEKI